MALSQDQSTPNKVFSLIFPLSEKQLQLISDDSLQRDLEAYFHVDNIPPRSGLRGNINLASLFSAELGTPVLDELREYLHFISPRNPYHVDPLNEQYVKKRQAVITENPGLHLVWYYDTIFIKPIPHFLLNFTFWREFLLPPLSADMGNQQSELCTFLGRNSYPIESLDSHCKSALGFLRSYALLIRHRSDFHIAQSLHLLPEDVTYWDFCAFIKPFCSLPNSVVSHRYMYGQMRLTRLNWAVRFLQPRSVSIGSWFANRLYYQELYTQSRDYATSWLPPLLFAFAALSLVLSAIQVMVTAQGLSPWGAFTHVAWGFSLATILFCTIASSILLVYFPILLLGQGIYALRCREKSMPRVRHTRSKV